MSAEAFFSPTSISKVSVCNLCHGLVSSDFEEEHLRWHATVDAGALAEAIVAIERTLGINPQGTHSTVVERLDHIELVQHNQAQHFHIYTDESGDSLTSEMRIKL